MTTVTSNDKRDFQNLHLKGVGSSEIASVIGVNPYQTALQLWEVKTGKAPFFEGNKFTRAGHKLEPIVVEYFSEETGYDIDAGFEGDITFFHKEHGHLLCTPDRFFGILGRKGILECKSTQKRILDVRKEWNWISQLQYQLGICGLEFGAIAWLERGLDFHYEIIEFDPVLFDALVGEATEFWNHVLNDTPPPVQTSGDVQRLYKAVGDKSVEATKETYGAYNRLVEVRKQLKELNKEKEQIEEQMKMVMRDAESIHYGDDILMTWKESKSNRLNQSALKSEQPNLYDYYSYESRTRRFLVK